MQVFDTGVELPEQAMERTDTSVRNWLNEQSLAQYGVELDHIETVAITRLVRGIASTSDQEIDIYFDILQVPERLRSGVDVSERYLILNELFNQAKSQFCEPTQDETV